MRRLWNKLWPPLPIWRGLDLGVLAVMVYALVIELIVDNFGLHAPKWIGDVTVVNAVLLGVLLAFRNKEAYDRWWEARKLWGQLVNDTRNLALKFKAYASIGPEDGRLAGVLLFDFATELKTHLRDRRPGRHRPADAAEALYVLLHDWQAQKKLTEFEMLMLDTHARNLMDICGACERIQTTPVPLSYRSLLRHGTVLYLLSAPWFMAGEFGYWSIVIVGLIAYFLLGTELTAESIEEPFGTGGDDLDLDKYCLTIRTSIEEILHVELTPAAENKN